jgi:hypothetical protein
MLNFRPRGLIPCFLVLSQTASKYSLNMLLYGLMCSNFSILEIHFPEKCVSLLFLGAKKMGLRENLPIRIMKLVSIIRRKKYKILHMSFFHVTFISLQIVKI